ncbi:hypothetical protein V2W45_1348044 [Cenococcum geophilum]
MTSQVSRQPPSYTASTQSAPKTEHTKRPSLLSLKHLFKNWSPDLLRARDGDGDDYNFTSGRRRGAGDYNFTSGDRRGAE